jgi:hypothetical protein
MGRMKSAYKILPEGTRSFGRPRRSLYGRRILLKFMLNKSSIEVKNMFTCLRIRLERWDFVGRLKYLRVTE